SIGSIPAKTGLHQDKMRNKSRMNENSAQGQVFITSGARCRHYLFSNMDQQHEWHTSYSHEECAVFRRSGIGKLSIPLLDPNPASRLEGNKGGYLPLSADRVP